MNKTERAREVLQMEMAGIRRVHDELGEPFERAVEDILETLAAGGRLVLTGMGKCYHIACKLVATLNSTGTPAAVLHPSEAMHGDLGVIGPKDLLLAMSYSGASDELVSLIPAVRRLDIPIIAMTGELDSPLAKHSDEVLPVTVDREACPFNMAPTTSTTAMLALGDALAIVLLEARGFRKEDYARLHPGGAIGRTLLLSVSDIMRRDDRVAAVKCGQTVKEAVLAMTRARAGSVAVLDDDKKVLGVFTDGDFRRHFEDLAGLGGRPIDEVMTPDPVTVQQDALAVEVLSVFEHRNIDDLLVVDEQGRLVGLVDIQDLPKLKIL